ncbi:MAG: DUF4249 domain-containing protein [Chitinophagaceae bacterium]|nr:MAG: DUF4249 domain-containing protein [Chitinophagaceae bacterium]
MRLYTIVLSALTLLIVSCENMQQDIELELPEYENKLVVESYLERGKPFRVTLTESQAYFDQPGNPVIQDALVIITYGENTDTLEFNPSFLDLNTLKVYNFVSENTVPEDFDGPYTLYVKDNSGREAVAETSFIEELNLDTIRLQYNSENEVLLLISFTDPPVVANYYRLIVNKDSLTAAPDVSFQLSDGSLDGEQITLGTGYDYEIGDTVFVTLFHLSEKYFRFLATSSSAQSAQGNPFGQPGAVETNIEGGLGIFVALTYDRRKLIIPAK